MKRIAGYILASLFGSTLAIGTMMMVEDRNAEAQLEIERLKAQHREDNSNQFVSYGLPLESVDFVDAAERTVNAVVHVKTTYQLDGGYYTFDPIRHFFFGDGMNQMPPRMGAGAGSGVIISEDGYIVTNNHVVTGAASIEVALNNNKTYPAELVGQDPSSDLALLKVNASELPSIEFGNSDQVRVGEWVLAVGNPFNLESTVTAGIVSAKGRDINILANGPDGANAVESFIQTDAAVNPGNSGGALVNAKGQLIGINAAIKSNTGSYAGYSFAIPVNIVSKVVEDLLEYGTVQRGYLGVNIRNIDQKLADEEGLSGMNGVYIAEALERGAAKTAGIKDGDIIIRVAEKEIKNVTELQEQVSRFRPGDKVLLTVNRQGTVMDIPVTLRNRFGEADVTPKQQLELHEKLGAIFENVPDEKLHELNITQGVQVKELGNGKLKSAGIMQDFIITAVDQEPVKSKDHLFEILEQKSGGVLMEGVYPNGKKAYYGFGI